MALEAVVFPQAFHGCTHKELLHTMGEEGGGSWSYGLEGIVNEDYNYNDLGMEWGGLDECRDVNLAPSCSSSMAQTHEEWHQNPSKEEKRKKRRRARACKNKEEMESQRMTHIAVERNRRKLMNDYLSVLRSIIPPSYVQRGDQASIVGGAINYVKELEQLLQSLEAKKQMSQDSMLSFPFTGFFIFPQYSSTSTTAPALPAPATHSTGALADIEVTIVENHASLKVLSRRRPKQLLKMVIGLHNSRLTTLHLNMNTIDQMVLYSFSVKLEEDCQLTTVDEIATAVHQLIERIQDEAGFT